MSASPSPARPRAALYALVVAGSIAAITAVIHLGTQWFPTASGAEVAATANVPHGVVASPLALLLAQLLVIVAATQLGGRVARRLRQPAVIGEIAAGLMLGPSLLGLVAPAASAWLFPPASLPALSLVSQLGVILFMFTVGLEFDVAHLRRQAPTAVAVSHVSIAFPYLLGVLAALWLFPMHAPAGVPFQAFALFMGIALSITAFPVLARILDERGLTTTPLGATALACAAVDDVTAWTLLAIVVALVTTGGAVATLGATLTALALFMAVCLWMVRPLVARLTATPQSAVSPAALGGIIGTVLAAALATELIGLHALFGAFVAGAIMPRQAALRQMLRDRVQALTSVLLLPAFFAFTGLRTQVGSLESAAHWLVCLAIIGLAVAGKVGGTVVAARWTGTTWRDAWALGALMNTRGLMELVALNVGYDLGVLSSAMFTMLVVMALVTTTMTGPLVDRFLGRQAAA